MSTETDARPAAPEPAAPAPRRIAPQIAVVAVVAVVALVVAIALGTFSSGAPSADSVDVGFAQDMTVHHRQAVEMASWERDNTRDPALRQLAYDIENTQNQQIGRMQGWLGLWNMPALPTGGYMRWMGDAAGTHGSMSGMNGMSQMPGMASSEDLRRLRTTPERGLDVVFLQLMLRHHEGGAGMLAYGRDHAGNAEVRNLADQMYIAQTAESDLMKRMLADRGAQPLPL